MLPIIPGTKRPATESPADGSGGVNSATNKANDVRDYFVLNPEANVAIAMGRVSGDIICIDIDIGHESGADGFETLARWERENGELPETVQAVTPKGGCHMLYRVADSTQVGNSANTELGVDIKSNGGYIIAHPSTHPTAPGRYEWEHDPDEYDLADADENVMAFIRHVQEGVSVSSICTVNHVATEKFVLPNTIERMSRNDTLYKFACSELAKGARDEEVLQRVLEVNEKRCQPELPEREIKTLVKSAIRWYRGNHEDRQIKPEDTNVKPGEPTDNGRVIPEREIVYDANGGMVKTLYNAVRAAYWDAALHGRLLFAENRLSPVIVGPVPWNKTQDAWEPRDEDRLHFREYMEQRYGFKKSDKDLLADAFVSVASYNSFNPVTQWLDSLVWDGEERLRTLLSAVMGVRCTDYAMEVSRLTILGAVARAYEPGVKFDTMTILQGTQGSGKSTFVQMLAHCPEWFTDSIGNISNIDKMDAVYERMRGMWIIEMGELSQLQNFKDAETIKSFLSSQSDVFRQKYARDAEQHRRRCVFIGTTNRRKFLNDASGNRRFLPVVCMEVEPTFDILDQSQRAQIEEYINQCYAEAVHIWKTEHPALRLADNVVAYANEAQDDFTEDDPRVGMIQGWLDQQAELGDAGSGAKVCAAMLMEHALGLDLSKVIGNRAIQREIQEIMDNKITGWELYGNSKDHRYEFGGAYKKQICWVPVSDRQNNCLSCP